MYTDKDMDTEMIEKLKSIEWMMFVPYGPPEIIGTAWDFHNSLGPDVKIREYQICISRNYFIY